jgi:hypothetical protein
LVRPKKLKVSTRRFITFAAESVTLTMVGFSAFLQHLKTTTPCVLTLPKRTLDIKMIETDVKFNFITSTSNYRLYLINVIIVHTVIILDIVYVIVIAIE